MLSARRHARGRPASARARVDVPDDPSVRSSDPTSRPVTSRSPENGLLVQSSCPAERRARQLKASTRYHRSTRWIRSGLSASMSIVRATCTRVRRRCCCCSFGERRQGTFGATYGTPHTGRRARKQQPLIDRRPTRGVRPYVRTCVRVTRARLGRMSRARTAHGRAGGNDARAACSLADDAQRGPPRARLVDGGRTRRCTCVCTRTYPRPTACASAKLPVHRDRSRRHALAFLYFAPLNLLFTS